MSKDFIREVLRLDPNPADPEHRAQWAELTRELLDQDPELKAEIISLATRLAKQEGEQEGEARTLKHLLELKLTRALSTEEGAVFTTELRRIGTDGVSQLLFASNKDSLAAWLSPQPTKDKK